MIPIKKLEDIKNLERNNAISKELAQFLSPYLVADLKLCKEWSDLTLDYEEDFFAPSAPGEQNLENYVAGDNGYIALILGTETTKELEEQIGLTGGLDAVIPESVEFIDYEDFTISRLIVVYNNSFTMSLYLLFPCNRFVSYATP